MLCIMFDLITTDYYAIQRIHRKSWTSPSPEPPKRRDILVINVWLVILLIHKSATLKYSHKIGENLIF